MALCLPLPVAHPRPSLSQMLSDADALVTDFMDAYAAELPPELAQVCTTARDLFLKRHLRVRLGQLFRLSVKAAEEVLHVRGVTQEIDFFWIALVVTQVNYVHRPRYKLQIYEEIAEKYYRSQKLCRCKVRNFFT